MSKLDITFYYNNRKDLAAFQVFHQVAINEYNYWLISEYNAFNIDIYLLLDDLDSKIIALDWDNTISADTVLYQQLIQEWRKLGFTPVVCSLREDDEKNRNEMYQQLNDQSIALYLTNGIAKLKFMKKRGITIHLWIDDFFPGICKHNNQLVQKNGIDY